MNTYTKLPLDRSILIQVVAGPVVTKRDQEAVLGGFDGVQMVSIPRGFLGTSISKALGGIRQRDLCLLLQGTPGIQNAIGGNVDLVEMAVEHVLTRFTTDFGKIMLGNVVCGNK